MLILVIRLVVVFAVLSIIYTMFVISGRLIKRAKLKTAYKVSDQTISEDEFVANGMKRYDRSLSAKKYLLIFLVPVLIIIAIVIKSKY